MPLEVRRLVLDILNALALEPTLGLDPFFGDDGGIDGAGGGGGGTLSRPSASISKNDIASIAIALPFLSDSNLRVSADSSL